MSGADIETAAAVLCPNCGSGSVRVYCPDCGQKLPKAADYSTTRFVQDTFHEVAEVDGKTLKSIRKLITEPGGLTRAHWAGQRSQYLAPLKIYLMMTALFFSLVPAASSLRDQIRLVANDPSASTALPSSQELAKRMETPEFDKRFEVRYKALLAVSVSGLALITWTVFRQRPYGAHLVASLHIVAFLFLLTTGFTLVGRWIVTPLVSKPAGDALVMGELILYYLYLWRTLRTLFGHWGFPLLWRVAVVIGGTLLIDAMVAVGAIVWSLTTSV